MRLTRAMPLKRVGVFWITVVFAAVGTFLFLYRYLEDASYSNWPDWRPIFINEMSGAVATYLLFWPLYWFTNRYPISGAHAWRNAGLHMLVLPLWSFLQTSFMAMSRPPVYQLVLGRAFDYGDMPIRYLMEFSMGVFVFWTQVGVIAAFRFQYELRQREVRTAQLERELTQAHLDALRLQLRPHFLFNALNAVSSVMYEDPRKADRMIASLSDFLRAVLRQESTHTVPLAEEMRLLEQYLGIMQVRFGDRLRVELSIPKHLHRALVPPLLLQPLVENCVQHGVDPATGILDIQVSAVERDSQLELRVRDHGPGPAPATPADPVRKFGGIGLGNTERRLQRLYGEGVSLSLSLAEGGGALATVRMPLERSEEEETAPEKEATHAGD